MNTNNMTRTEAYNTIKSMGLQDACFKKFGKNFTMCKTADLIALIEENKDSKEEASATLTAPAQYNGCVDTVARAAITRLAEILEECGSINECEEEEILYILGGGVVNAATIEDENQPKSSYSDDDIDTMFADM